MKGFLRDARFDGGSALADAVFSVAPELRPFLTPGRVLPVSVKQWVRQYYRKDSERVEEDMIAAKRAWSRLAPAFFQFTDEIFGTLPWPQGKYIAYPTVWGMFPRYLEDKTFQIPVRFRRKKLIPVVVAHELLHFICYQYLFRTRPELKKERNTFLAWHVTELFNSVVQTTASWRTVFGAIPLDYPMHEKILYKLRRKYTSVSALNRESLIDDLVKEAKKLVAES